MFCSSLTRHCRAIGDNKTKNKNILNCLSFRCFIKQIAMDINMEYLLCIIIILPVHYSISIKILKWTSAWQYCCAFLDETSSKRDFFSKSSTCNGTITLTPQNLCCVKFSIIFINRVKLLPLTSFHLSSFVEPLVHRVMYYFISPAY